MGNHEPWLGRLWYREKVDSAPMASEDWKIALARFLDDEFSAVATRLQNFIFSLNSIQSSPHPAVLAAVDGLTIR
jgi:hypothetical protein